jgi:uncharacterized protein with GYD domain
MPKFMISASYTIDGLRGLRTDGGSGRLDASRKAIDSVGGHLDAMYFAFGEQDAFILCDLPDNKAAAAVSLMVGAAGGVNTKTVVLLTPEEVDRATVETVDYRAPGV